jgi:hypothetical protein
MKSEMGSTCSINGETTNIYKILIIKCHRRPPRRCSCRLKNNIKMGLGELGCKMKTGIKWLRIGYNGWNYSTCR